MKAGVLVITLRHMANARKIENDKLDPVRTPCYIIHESSLRRVYASTVPFHSLACTEHTCTTDW
jgi:hypothetical protein